MTRLVPSDQRRRQAMIEVQRLEFASSASSPPDASRIIRCSANGAAFFCGENNDFTLVINIPLSPRP
jgi:hypothetical protein